MGALAVAALTHAAPAAAHDLPVGGSRWCFGKSAIIANIDLSRALLAQIGGVEKAGVRLDGMSDEQLSRLAADVLQPYLDAKLSVAQGDRRFPVKLTRIVSNGDIYTLWLSVENITIDPARPITINYGLLLEETNRAHVNLAYGYVSDATGDGLRRVFDFSPPTVQHTFDASAQTWEVRVGGALANPGPETTPRRSAAAERRSPSIEPPNERVRAQPSGARGTTGAAILSGGRAREATDTGKATADAPRTTPDEPRGAPVGSAQVEPAPASPWSNVARFLILGVEHILTGYDHIAFLLAVVVVGLSLQEVLKTITAFTVAHSITLLLAALDVVRVNPRLVESAIAVSICVVACENLFKDRVSHRWLMTFGFGLIHGFGFASALRELVVGRANLLASVVSFNVGVELGQMLIFLAVLPVLRVLTGRVEGRRVTVYSSLLIFALGLAWLAERTLDMKALGRLG